MGDSFLPYGRFGDSDSFFGGEDYSDPLGYNSYLEAERKRREEEERKKSFWNKSLEYLGAGEDTKSLGEAATWGLTLPKKVLSDIPISYLSGLDEVHPSQELLGNALFPKALPGDPIETHYNRQGIRGDYTPQEQNIASAPVKGLTETLGGFGLDPSLPFMGAKGALGLGMDLYFGAEGIKGGMEGLGTAWSDVEGGDIESALEHGMGGLGGLAFGGMALGAAKGKGKEIPEFKVGGGYTSRSPINLETTRYSGNRGELPNYVSAMSEGGGDNPGFLDFLKDDPLLKRMEEIKAAGTNIGPKRTSVTEELYHGTGQVDWASGDSREIGIPYKGGRSLSIDELQPFIEKAKRGELEPGTVLPDGSTFLSTDSTGINLKDPSKVVPVNPTFSSRKASPINQHGGPFYFTKEPVLAEGSYAIGGEGKGIKPGLITSEVTTVKPFNLEGPIPSDVMTRGLALINQARLEAANPVQRATFDRDYNSFKKAGSGREAERIIGDVIDRNPNLSSEYQSFSKSGAHESELTRDVTKSGEEGIPLARRVDVKPEELFNRMLERDLGYDSLKHRSGGGSGAEVTIPFSRKQIKIKEVQPLKELEDRSTQALVDEYTGLDDLGNPAQSEMNKLLFKELARRLKIHEGIQDNPLFRGNPEKIREYINFLEEKRLDLDMRLNEPETNSLTPRELTDMRGERDILSRKIKDIGEYDPTEGPLLEDFKFGSAKHSSTGIPEYTPEELASIASEIKTSERIRPGSALTQGVSESFVKDLFKPVEASIPQTGPTSKPTLSPNADTLKTILKSSGLTKFTPESIVKSFESAGIPVPESMRTQIPGILDELISSGWVNRKSTGTYTLNSTPTRTSIPASPMGRVANLESQLKASLESKPVKPIEPEVIQPKGREGQLEVLQGEIDRAKATLADEGFEIPLTQEDIRLLETDPRLKKIHDDMIGLIDSRDSLEFSTPQVGRAESLANPSLRVSSPTDPGPKPIQVGDWIDELARDLGYTDLPGEGLTSKMVGDPKGRGSKPVEPMDPEAARNKLAQQLQEIRDMIEDKKLREAGEKKGKVSNRTTFDYPKRGDRDPIRDKLMSIVPKTVAESQRMDVFSSADSALQRGLETARESSPTGNFIDSGKDIQITLTRVDPNKLNDRGDYHMPHDKLIDVLNQGGELTPITVGKIDDAYFLKDGHHRMRAYQDTKKPALAFVTEVIDGNGKVHVIDEVSSPKSQTGPSIRKPPSKTTPPGEVVDPESLEGGKPKLYTVTLNDGTSHPVKAKSGEEAVAKAEEILGAKGSKKLVTGVKERISSLERAAESEVNQPEIKGIEELTQAQAKEEIKRLEAEGKIAGKNATLAEKDRITQLEKISKAQTSEELKARNEEARNSQREGKLREAAHAKELATQLKVEENWKKAQEKALAKLSKKPKLPLKPVNERPLRNLMDTIKGFAFSGDLGHFNRQGKQSLLMLATSDPKAVPGVIKSTFKQGLSEAEFIKFHEKISGDPEFARMAKDFKLDVPGMEQYKAEEAFAGGKAESIPVLGKYYVRPSDRGYTGGMNAIRYALTKNRLEAMKKQGLTMEKNPEAYRSLARGINVITQRGDFGPVWQQALTDVSGFLGAPRNRLSRMQQMQTILESGESGKLARRGIAHLAGWNLLLFGALKGMYGDEIEFVSDPDRSDFLKMRRGNITVDPWVGLGAPVRTMMRPFGLASKAFDNDTGRVSETSFSEAIGQDIGNMLAPGILLAWELVSGKDVRGYLKDRSSALWNIAPLSLRGIKEIAEEGKFDNFIFSLMELTGEQVGVFNRERANEEQARIKESRGIPASGGGKKRKLSW